MLIAFSGNAADGLKPDCLQTKRSPLEQRRAVEKELLCDAERASWSDGPDAWRAKCR